MGCVAGNGRTPRIRMIQKPNKFFMNEEGASPGGGAALPPPAEPTAAPTAPAIDVDALVTRLTGVIDEKITASQNATFANLRKAGVLKQDKPSDPTPTQPTPSAPAVAQAGLSQADLDARFELERVVASREGKHGLNEAQSKRLRIALSGVARESLAAEADSYLSDMGLVKAAAPPAPAPQPASQATTPAKPNISDRGTAAPTDTRDFEGVLNSRPLEITAHDVDELRIKHGDAKGLQMLQDRINAALRGVKISPPSGGRQR